ncbi:hypothetical protein HYX01_04020 [Candidatus Woesearchaeota archaeon]|nr:hypothetical protein [Candidatus Woesearchaeota archaeon]
MMKKGIFYTFAAIALSMIILLSFSVYKTYEMKEKAELIGTRIDTMNDFIKDIEQDLEKGLYIASFRAFASISDYITSNGSFIGNVDAAFSELALQGTLNNQQQGLMKDSTFTDWTKRIQLQADKIGIISNFTVINLTINQTDSWSVLIGAKINLTVKDKKNTSSWKRTKEILAKVSIENFEDPLYVVNSKGRVTNDIARSPITNFVNGDDVSNLMLHLNNSYYIASNTSPNFLMRLQGILSNSSTGIESLVNLQKFQEQSLGIKDRSAVDYIYFGTVSTVNYRINQTPSWFKLDSSHLKVYQVENMTI